MDNIKRPLVSVNMITYGHEQVIARAINGVLMQRGDFDLELIIADDCSPDDTEAVVKACIAESEASGLKRNQDQVIYHRHKNNMGMAANFLWTWEACRGDYIAICEGDDEWTDENKIQIQIDTLSRNDAIICFHEIEVIGTSKSYLHHEKYNILFKEYTYNTLKVFTDGVNKLPQTATYFFRNIPLSLETRLLMLSTLSCDHMMFFTLLNEGKGIYIPKLMARHYVLETGASSTFNQGKWLLNRIESYQFLTKIVRIENVKAIREINYRNLLLYWKRFASKTEKFIYIVKITKALFKLREWPERRDIRFMFSKEYR